MCANNIISYFRIESTKRLPLRDAVERRIPPDDVYEPEVDIDLNIDNDYQNHIPISKNKPLNSYSSAFVQNHFVTHRFFPQSFLRTPPLVLPQTLYNPLIHFQNIAGNYRYVEPYRSDNFYQQLVKTPRRINLEYLGNPFLKLNSGNYNLKGIINTQVFSDILSFNIHRKIPARK